MTAISITSKPAPPAPSGAPVSVCGAGRTPWTASLTYRSRCRSPATISPPSAHDAESDCSRRTAPPPKLDGFGGNRPRRRYSTATAHGNSTATDRWRQQHRNRRRQQQLMGPNTHDVRQRTDIDISRSFLVYRKIAHALRRNSMSRRAGMDTQTPPVTWRGQNELKPGRGDLNANPADAELIHWIERLRRTEFLTPAVLGRDRRNRGTQQCGLINARMAECIVIRRPAARPIRRQLARRFRAVSPRGEAATSIFLPTNRDGFGYKRRGSFSNCGPLTVSLRPGRRAGVAEHRTVPKRSRS
jgi:hypothetical protein